MVTEGGPALIERAKEMIVTGQLDEGYRAARKAVRVLSGKPEEGAALNVLAEIQLERGEVDEARSLLLRSVELDSDGLAPEYLGGGPEKFLHLAQICEDGGEESVRWFEKGAEVLRAQLASLTISNPQGDGIEGAAVEEKSSKLAAALCGIIEVYMTDLSFSSDAESKCESLITEALLVGPDDPGTLQTLANVRISQGRTDEAVKALKDSLALWNKLPPEEEGVPAFASRISLARLLMEVEMLKEALDVLERLVVEDDRSVEAWYLGGWCLHLLSGTANTNGVSGHRATTNGHTEEEEGEEGSTRRAQVASREWLRQSLKLYEALDYEDERLAEHAKELVKELDEVLGPDTTGEDDADDDGGDEDEDWEDDSDGDGDGDAAGAGEDEDEDEGEDENMHDS